MFKLRLKNMTLTIKKFLNKYKYKLGTKVTFF